MSCRDKTVGFWYLFPQNGSKVTFFLGLSKCWSNIYRWYRYQISAMHYSSILGVLRNDNSLRELILLHVIDVSLKDMEKWTFIYFTRMLCEKCNIGIVYYLYADMLYCLYKVFQYEILLTLNRSCFSYTTFRKARTKFLSENCYGSR